MHRTDDLDEAIEIAKDVWGRELKMESHQENHYEAGIHVYDTYAKKDIDFTKKKYQK